MSARSKAYAAGYADGLAWDLDGFASAGDVGRAPYGWDEATINAMGTDHCAREWGVTETEGDEWETACDEYNRGAHAGALAPQEHRTGLPPRARDSV